jgi:hypothetical protein
VAFLLFGVCIGAEAVGIGAAVERLSPYVLNYSSRFPLHFGKLPAKSSNPPTLNNEEQFLPIR